MQYMQSSEQCYTEGNTFIVFFGLLAVCCLTGGLVLAGGDQIFQNLTVRGDRSFRGTRPYVTDPNSMGLSSLGLKSTYVQMPWCM